MLGHFEQTLIKFQSLHLWNMKPAIFCSKMQPGIIFRVIKNGSFKCKFNPFLPTRQFMAPKLIILIKCLIDVLFFSVVLMFLCVEQDVNLA